MTNSGLDPRDQELIAAFIDRRMPEEERRAFMERLDREETLYEVFVETVRFRDQQTERPAAVIPHPASRRQWSRLAAVAAVVAIAVATPVVLRNLPAARYAPQLVADGLMATVLEDEWYVKGWPVTRGPHPDTSDFETAFRLGVRHVDLEVALRTGRREDAAVLTGELEHLLSSVASAEPLQVLYSEARQRAGEPEWALQRVEESEPLLRDQLGDAGTAYDLGKWTEAGVLAARSGNTDLLRSRAFRRSLGYFRSQEWPGLAGELEAIATLLEPAGEELDLPRLERAFAVIIDQS